MDPPSSKYGISSKNVKAYCFLKLTIRNKASHQAKVVAVHWSKLRLVDRSLETYFDNFIKKFELYAFDLLRSTDIDTRFSTNNGVYAFTVLARALKKILCFIP